MTTISAAAVKALRDETNVGMMECKKALTEAGGDRAKAIQLLRERGVAIAGKKAGRAARSGLVASYAAGDGSVGALVEVNCETDFVARNDVFQAFVASLAEKAAEQDGELAPRVKDEVTAKIAEIGENIVVRRNVRFVREGHGLVATYIHLGSKVGVMIEVACTKPETETRPEFQELARDLTLHVAACQPEFLVRDEVPEAVVERERAIYAKQVEDKPAAIIDRIVAGKLEKFYAQAVFMEQPFVKDADRSVAQVIADAGRELDDTLRVRRACRYQLGE